MPEVEAKIRSRKHSTASDPRMGVNRWKRAGEDGTPGTPVPMGIDEFKPRKKPSKQHPAEQKKAVMMKMGSLEDKKMSDAYKKSPRSMIRRFSRAASFKRARQRFPVLDLKGILNQFEKHSTIHGICHAGLAPNKKWRHFWLGVFTVCFAILIVQTIYLVVKFFQYPKTVDLDLKFEMTEFPAVTICNLNPYKASAISRDKKAQATIDAMETILHDSDTEISTSTLSATVVQSPAKPRTRREPSKQRRNMADVQHAIEQIGERRYMQVYAQCYCQLNRLSSVRKRGSCYAAYKGRVSFTYQSGQELHVFYPAKCLCQLDWVAKALWPCFPYNSWKEHICTECVDLAGHCPMRFLNYRTVGQNRSSGLHAIETLDEGLDVCICHRDYNHCVQNNLNGEIPEILPSDELDALNFTRHLKQWRPSVSKPTVPAAVHAALRKEEAKQEEAIKKEAQKEALGFKNLTDEIAIKGQARQNLIYAMGEKTEQERIGLSHPIDEMILKCSFNQHDCDIKKDFKLYQDPTYGNCYTFNWDRNSQVTAHRAGANFGLRVLVYANVSEYLPTTEAIGFRITVHDKWTVPFVDAFGYNAPTGMLSAYGVRMKKFERLEHPYGHCRTGGELPEWYIYPGYNYSVEGCHRSCTQQEVVRTCGCADPMFPMPQKARRCAMQEQKARECIQNTTSRLSSLIAEEGEDSCKCPLPCYETAYELTYSAARWPSGTAKLMECASTDELCMEKYRINAALIQVFYEEFNYQTLTESAAYSVTSLIADLGGLSGLWIGISVVSILEVVQLIWFCMEYIHKKRTSELLAMVRGASRRHSLDEESEEPRKKSGGSSLSGIQPRSGSGGTKSLKSLRSIRSFMQGAAGEIYPPNLRVKGEIVYSHSSGSSTPYLAPGVELPCTCLYGARGQIVFMKPLCPFHGYMVRRMMRKKNSSSSESEEEGDDDGLEEGPLLTLEEVEALRREAELDRIESATEEEGEQPIGNEKQENDKTEMKQVDVEDESSSSTSDEKK